ncbi:conserved hypothetical protein [Ricinus communis]|uniref:Uncharacterized protein n=1 Tax=Ricinus communis TaxID=3988 RepID=B9RSA4_RICCO|nr:conserved hypothetical protein [Ricinus communis]
MAIPGSALIVQFRKESVVGHWIPSDLENMVNHYFNREREVIQNPLAPELAEVPHADLIYFSKFGNIVRRRRSGCPLTFQNGQKSTTLE